MLLKRIRLKNFRSFSDREFTFSNGLNLLVGPNGAGKSTIFEAIGTVLFNSPKTSLKDAISTGKDYGSIYLEFDNYKLRRSFGSLIEYVLETPEGKYEGKETVLSKLSQILGIPNLESFWYDVLTIKQFAKLRPFDGTPNERLLLFGRILGIERYEQEFNYLKDVLAYGKKVIDKLRDELDEALERNQETKKHNKDVESEKANLPVIQELYTEALDKLEEARNRQAGIAQRATDRERRKHLEGYLAQLEYKLAIPAGNRKLYERQLKEYSTALDQHQVAFGRWLSQVESYDKKIAYLRKLEATCPVCGGPLSDEHRDGLIANLIEESNQLSKPVFTLGEPLKPQRWDDDGVAEEVKRVKEELFRIPNIPDEEVEDITSLARQAAQYEQGIKTIQALETKELEDLTDKKELFRLYQDAYDQIELYRKGVKEKISTIPVEARKAISVKANTLYQSFMEGHHSVGLTLDSSYGVIATIRGQDVPFASLGGAESVTAALAVRLAIAHYLARDIDLLFLDEATDALDRTAQEQMVRIVEELEGQVFVITHENVFTKGNVVEV